MVFHFGDVFRRFLRFCWLSVMDFCLCSERSGEASKNLSAVLTEVDNLGSVGWRRIEIYFTSETNFVTTTGSNIFIYFLATQKTSLLMKVFLVGKYFELVELRNQL